MKSTRRGLLQGVRICLLNWVSRYPAFTQSPPRVSIATGLRLVVHMATSQHQMASVPAQRHCPGQVYGAVGPAGLEPASPTPVQQLP